MEEVIEEVRDYMARTRGHYGRLLAAIVGELGDLRDRARNHDLVYRIYTRGDKQLGGDLFKSDIGIARKLNRWRTEDGFHYPVCEVHDIIGATIVTFFESGVEKVVSLLERIDAFRSFKYIKTEVVNRGGYSASHVVVEGRGVSRSRLRCEIQVKALLNDSWATKTHDLTYKRDGEILDPRLQKLVEEIGNQLQRVEIQSQQLRDMILFNQETDLKRREAAVNGLFGKALEALHKSEVFEIASAAATLMTELDRFTTCHQEDDELVEFVETLQSLPRSGREARASCNLAMLLAASRQDRDLDEFALDLVDHWAETAQGNEREEALGFKAQCRWSLGHLDHAIKTAEQLVSLCADANEKSHAKLDLAYYRAEQIYAAGLGKDREAVSETRNLIKKIAKAPTPRRQMFQEDSKGAILIMTAQNVHDVTNGLKLCEKAWSWAQEHPELTELFRGFYNLHVARANRQLKAFARD